MTLYSVIVLIKLYPEFGNDGYIVMCNFGGSSMNGFETIGGGRAFETPSVGEAKKKRSGLNRVNERCDFRQ